MDGVCLTPRSNALLPGRNGKTAWRIEGTLREFARFAPVNLWFDYPVHQLDSGLLEDLQPETDFRTAGRAGAAKTVGCHGQRRTRQRKT